VSRDFTGAVNISSTCMYSIELFTFAPRVEYSIDRLRVHVYKV